MIAEPGVPRNATYPAHAYSQPLCCFFRKMDLGWPGNTATCNMNITVQETFTIKCLNKPMKVYIAADNWYILNLGSTGLRK